ncbi:MAG: peptidoglycan DD-metalloendopeptidase family protein [Methylococcales bacterium]|nr:peptidoglycan DD-metalloendopeptidase family protein [Methylococcales bacterium]
MYPIALLWGVLLVLLGAVRAESLTTEQRLRQLDQQIAQLNQELAQTEQNRDTWQQKLAEVEARESAIAAHLHQLKREQQQTRQHADATRQKIHTLHSKSAHQHHQLSRQVRLAYQLGPDQHLKVILNQQQPERLSRMLGYHKVLNRYRLDHLETLAQQLQAEQQLALEQRATLATLAEQQEAIEQQQAALKQEKQQRAQLLSELERDYRSEREQLAVLQRDHARLEQVLLKLLQQQQSEDSAAASAQAHPEPTLGPRGILPVVGKVVQRFGSQRARRRWDGILIAAPEGSEVHAMATGEVVFSDWLKGYGHLLIIDHGKELMTLYAFNQSLYKKVGDRVQAGDIIALAGRSGGRRDAALYFGVRKRGKAVDPLHWLSRR